MATRKPRTKNGMLAGMKEAARVAAVMFDGEDAQRIVTKRAMSYIASPHTNTNDYFDVDHEAFIRAKKSMKRLQRLMNFPSCAGLWVRVEGKPGYVTLAVQNGEISPYWQFGQYRLAVPPEMKACLDTGKVCRMPAKQSKGIITVLAPIADSLGDSVAVLVISALKGKG